MNTEIFLKGLLKLEFVPEKTSENQNLSSSVANWRKTIKKNIPTEIIIKNFSLSDFYNTKIASYKRVLTNPPTLFIPLEHEISKLYPEIKEINELEKVFAEKNPMIKGLKYSEIIKILGNYVRIMRDTNLDPEILILAISYFERIVSNGQCSSIYANVIAASSLIIAIKTNDLRNLRLKDVYSFIELHFGIKISEPIKIEFWVFAALEFTLSINKFELEKNYLKLKSIQEWT